MVEEIVLSFACVWGSAITYHAFTRNRKNGQDAVFLNYPFQGRNNYGGLIGRGRLFQYHEAVLLKPLGSSMVGLLQFLVGGRKTLLRGFPCG